MNGRAWNLGKLGNTTRKICHHLQTPYFGSFLSNLEDEAFMIFGKPFILLDFPSFGSKSWLDEVILRLSSGTYNLHRQLLVLVLSGRRTWVAPFLFWGQAAVDLDLDRMLCSLVQGSGWSMFLELVMHISYRNLNGCLSVLVRPCWNVAVAFCSRLSFQFCLFL